MRKWLVLSICLPIAGLMVILTAIPALLGYLIESWKRPYATFPENGK